MPIILQDIKCGEIVKVLAQDDDEVEEEYWAKVVSNEGNYLFVTYLSETDKGYKGAEVYSLDAHVNRVDFENLTEHHREVTDFSDVHIMRVGTNMYVFEDEYDMDDSDSEIYEIDGDEDEDEYDTTDGFVVPDTEIDGPVLPPPDAREIDRDWDSWNPQTAGQQRFKSLVDRMDELARHQADNMNF